MTAACLPGFVEDAGDAPSDRLARFRRELLGKFPQFLVLGGCGVEGLARLRRGQGDTSVSDLLPRRWAKKSIAEVELAFEISMTLRP